MVVDLMNFSKMDDQIAIKEAVIAILQSMEALVLTLSHQSSSSSSFGCSAIIDNTVSKFKKFINALDQTGHARFRRGPVQPPTESSSLSRSPVIVARPALIPPLAVSFLSRGLTLDFTNPNPPPTDKITGKGRFTDDPFSISPLISGNSSFPSLITADGSVSNGKGSSLFHRRGICCTVFMSYSNGGFLRKESLRKRKGIMVFTYFNHLSFVF
ncbi:probable WRKY transcription factor 11 [Asparagus officinalis]|uniref:probable WRKY transcription factor 11 n=1 Tax=Asparagus officinalis TaxID=4686 RepID=UPI00098DEF00|nr:probable WRKY transcription factor 11 [Asparagus officinalis]